MNCRLDRMKNSGIEWIGEIPEDWNLIKIGSVFQCRNEKVNDTDYPPLSVSKGGVVPQMESVAKTDANDNRKLVLKNDFVINSRSDRKQSCGLSVLDGSVSLINTVIYTIDEKIILPRYTDYLLKNYGFAEEFYRWGHGIVADLWTTRWQEMKNIALPLSSVEEQQRIVDYLDKKCAAVDRLMENQRLQIEKLKEYKQSVITEAVTKGLDKTVPLKPSGVEWIGDIPEGWNKAQIKYLFMIRTGGTLSKAGNINYYSTNDGLLWIKPDDLKEFVPITETKEYINDLGIKEIIAFPQGTLFVCCIGSIGKIGFTNRVSYCNQQINGLIAKEVIYNRFGLYAVYAQEKQHWYYSNGNVIKILNANNHKRVVIAVPPLSEQQQIAEYLDTKCAEIDGLISIKQQKIEKLTEYKKSLIYEYVTGKKQVGEDE